MPEFFNLNEVRRGGIGRLNFASENMGHWLRAARVTHVPTECSVNQDPC